MAKVKGPLFSENASGSVADFLTFSRRKTGQQARFQRKQVNRPTFKQVNNRALYSSAVEEWRLLSVFDRSSWDVAASGKHLTGFNLFVQNYIMGSIRRLADIRGVNVHDVFDFDSYVVPSGFRAVFCFFNIVWRTYGTPIRDGSVVLYNKSKSIDFFSTISTPPDNPDVSNLNVLSVDYADPTPVFSPGDILSVRNGSVDSGSGCSVDYEIYGYLVPI